MVDLWPPIRDRLAGAAVVAHGAGTEKRFLRAFPYHGFSPWIDTLRLARKVLPNLSRVLNARGREERRQRYQFGIEIVTHLFGSGSGCSKTSCWPGLLTRWRRSRRRR